MIIDFNSIKNQENKEEVKIKNIIKASIYLFKLKRFLKKLNKLHKMIYLNNRNSIEKFYVIALLEYESYVNQGFLYYNSICMEKHCYKSNRIKNISIKVSKGIESNLNLLYSIVNSILDILEDNGIV